MSLSPPEGYDSAAHKGKPLSVVRQKHIRHCMHMINKSGFSWIVPGLTMNLFFLKKISVKMTQSSENPPKGTVLTNRDKSYIFYTHMVPFLIIPATAPPSFRISNPVDEPDPLSWRHGIIWMILARPFTAYT